MSMLIDNSLWWSGSLCACYLGMVDASMAPALAYLVDIRWGIPCSLELFLSEPGALFHFRFVFQEIFLAKWKRSLPSRRMVSFSFRNLICGLIVRSKSLCDDVQSQKKKKKNSRPALFKSTTTEEAILCKWNVNSAPTGWKRESGQTYIPSLSVCSKKNSALFLRSVGISTNWTGNFFLNGMLPFAAESTVPGYWPIETLLGTRFGNRIKECFGVIFIILNVI